MSKFCKYQYVAGQKKGQTCPTFLRGKDSELCYKHKKFGKDEKVVPESKAEAKRVEEPTKIEHVNQEPVDQKAVSIIQEAKPVANQLNQSRTVKKASVIQLKAGPSSDSSYDSSDSSTLSSTSSSESSD